MGVVLLLEILAVNFIYSTITNIRYSSLTVSFRCIEVFKLVIIAVVSFMIN